MRLLRIVMLFCLLILLLTNSSFAQRNFDIGPVGHWGGYASCAVVKDNYAYICQGMTLSAFEVDGAKFIILDWLMLPNEATDLIIHNDHLYALCGQRGYTELYIINISNPTALQHIQSIDLAGFAWGGKLCAFGDFLYAAIDDKVFIVDISSPATASNLNSFEVYAEDIFVKDSYAYVATHNGLLIYNISDPMQISQVGSAIVNGGLSVDVVDNYAYVGVFAFNTAQFSNNQDQFKTGMQIVDISDPQNPQQQGYVDTIKEENGQVNNKRPIIVKALDDFVYIACENINEGESWFFIADVSDPVSPTIVGDMAIDEGMYPGPNSLDVIPPRAFISTGASSSGFLAIDISDPADPKIESKLEEPWDPLYLCSHGENLYISSAERLWIYECADPEKPRLAGSDNTWAGLRHFMVDGDYLYGVSDSAMVIIDVSNPGSLMEMGSYETTNGFCRRVCADGDVAYLLVIGQNQSSLETIDISDLLNPVLIQSYDLPGEGRDLYYNSTEKIAYVAYSENETNQGFKIIDISNAANPVEHSTVQSRGIPICITVADTLAYIGCNNVGGADSTWSIESISVADATLPVLKKDIAGHGYIFDLDVRDEFLFASRPTGSIYVYDKIVLAFLKVCPSPSSTYFAMIYFMLRNSWYIYTIDGYHVIASMAVSASYGIFSQVMNIFQSLISITVTPPETTVTPGSKVQYTATGYNEQGNKMPTNTIWYASDGGIDSTGLYTARNPGNFDILAMDTTHNVSGSATIAVKALAIESAESIPENYFLAQNYPNPFNPKTTIQFGLKKKSVVLLTLFDIKGREVGRILNREFSAGTYSVTVDAGNLASGVYFYKIRAESFEDVKKMLLMQ